jgi:hypothetical protein
MHYDSLLKSISYSDVKGALIRLRGYVYIELLKQKYTGESPVVIWTDRRNMPQVYGVLLPADFSLRLK